MPPIFVPSPLLYSIDSFQSRVEPMLQLKTKMDGKKLNGNNSNSSASRSKHDISIELDTYPRFLSSCPEGDSNEIMYTTDVFVDTRGRIKMGKQRIESWLTEAKIKCNLRACNFSTSLKANLRDTKMAIYLFYRIVPSKLRYKIRFSRKFERMKIG